ncbi:histidine kinase internal region (plasmid) [Gemmatirosa kalamazoonensis]|uniref:Histidine kinase internal region n=1 Tax=Gemmatirosa kalamazoonensis TaxID=861299 RepID=W0RS69_9BACT|nr:histidine kinase [Gemmatirosa kalamazoonensis]AHG92438.1 histidine kinase internal region [Gemmatirosa kalamazoonensis]
MSDTRLSSRRGIARLMLLVAPIAVVLTVLATAQEVVRSGGAYGVRGVGRALALNALDWFAWGPFVPLIVFVGERHRLDVPAHRLRRVAVWLALGLACCVGVGLVTATVVLNVPLMPRGAIPAHVPLPRFLPMWILNTAPFNLLLFCTIGGALHAVLAYDDLRRRQLREAELEARATRAELNVLRMQLQPHFFFNALHTVSSLMMTDVAAAQRVIASLGELVRASIDHTAAQEVRLGEELQFVERYLEIQRARFRSRLRVEVRVPDETLDAVVPSLILQPLVENAIRHGVERTPGGGAISIDAAREPSHLRLSVRNDCDAATMAVQRPGSGIGLANLEARLSQLYGADHSFHAGAGTDGAFVVVLRVPYRRWAA